MSRGVRARLWREGAAAFGKGLSYTRCPYERTTLHRRHWIDGWLEAERLSELADRDLVEPQSTEEDPMLVS
jgi:ribosome modulation factor